MRKRFAAVFTRPGRNPGRVLASLPSLALCFQPRSRSFI